MFNQYHLEIDNKHKSDVKYFDSFEDSCASFCFYVILYITTQFNAVNTLDYTTSVFPYASRYRDSNFSSFCSSPLSLQSLDEDCTLEEEDEGLVEEEDEIDQFNDDTFGAGAIGESRVKYISGARTVDAPAFIINNSPSCSSSR